MSAAKPLPLAPNPKAGGGTCPGCVAREWCLKHKRCAKEYEREDK